MFSQLSSDVQQIINHIIELTYFMRGSISYDSLLMERTFVERQLIAEFLHKRMEIESKSPHPVY